MKMTELDIERAVDCIGVFATDIVAKGENFVVIQTNLRRDCPTMNMPTLIRGLNSIGYTATVQDNKQLRVSRKAPNYEGLPNIGWVIFNPKTNMFYKKNETPISSILFAEIYSDSELARERMVEAGLDGFIVSTISIKMLD